MGSICEFSRTFVPHRGGLIGSTSQQIGLQLQEFGYKIAYIEFEHKWQIFTPLTSSDANVDKKHSIQQQNSDFKLDLFFPEKNIRAMNISFYV